MARLVAGILILLIPVAAGVTMPDAAGDVAQRVGGESLDEPAIDIRNVTGVVSEGRLELRLDVGAEIPTDTGDGSRRFSYLFMLAHTSDDGSIFQQVSEGRDAIAVLCDLNEGQADLSCRMSIGDAAIKGIGTDGASLSVRLDYDRNDTYQVGASTTISVLNETTQQREVIAQDFTDNALPYQTGPTTTDTGAAAPASTPWYRTPWIFALLAVAGIGVYAVVALRR